MSKMPSVSATSSDGSSGVSSVSSQSPLAPAYARLARYLYAAEFVVGKRILDIGCSDGEGAALLLDRGALSVLGFDLDRQAVARGQARLGSRGSLRAVTKDQLLTEGSLVRLCAGVKFEAVFVSGDRDWLTAPGFLAALRWLLSPNGQLFFMAQSKEAAPNAPGAIGYFELLDALENARLGPVTMLGQSPFFATALAPFGATEPALLLDDTLVSDEPPTDYVAVCGHATTQTYEVVRLPTQAALPKVRVEEREVRVADPQVAAERDRLAHELSLAQRERDGLREKVAEVRGQLDKATAQTDRLQTHADKLQVQADKLQTQLDRAAASRQETEVQFQGTLERLKISETARKKTEALLLEFQERDQQRSRRDGEAAEAALLHEKQMQELRTAIEEREAFVAELEEQARELPRLQERLAKNESRAEEAARSERQARQKLAEVEGLLLRAKTEMAEQLRRAELPQKLDAREREVEAARRELLVAQAELEQRVYALGQKEQASEQAAAVLADKALAERAQSEAAASAMARFAIERDEWKQERNALRTDLAEREERLRVLEKQIETARSVERPSHGSSANSDELDAVQAQNTALLAENAVLKEKVADSEREAWKQIKARSEAENAAAEVREDTVRKLRDARKLASVEITRAMEEATRKAVALKEELGRTEGERKEILGQMRQFEKERDEALRLLQKARLDLEALSPTRPVESTVEADLAQLSHEMQDTNKTLRAENARLIEAERTAQRQLETRTAQMRELQQTVLTLQTQLAEVRQNLESSARVPKDVAEMELRLMQEIRARELALLDLRSERDAMGRVLSEVEREAYARGERLRQLKAVLSERERELETLRIEVGDRDRRLTQLGNGARVDERSAHFEQAMQNARRRTEELLAELGQQRQREEDVVAAALREHSRAEQLQMALTQMTHERDQLHKRVEQANQQFGTVGDDDDENDEVFEMDDPVNLPVG